MEAAAQDVASASSVAAAVAHEATTAMEEAAAAALNAKELVPVEVSSWEAVVQASKKHKFCLISDDQDPPGSGSTDLISRLPDDLLCTIVSLLPTKEGARTQAISRRWRLLWRSAPLNLVDDEGLRSKGRRTSNLIQKILSEHPGPGRRFSVSLLTSGYFNRIEGWLSSQALDSLQELELRYGLWLGDRKKLCRLPPCAYRFAPTLRVAKFHGCCFPDLIMPKFPCLKQLTLHKVTISEDALQSMLSVCTLLESLELRKNLGISRLCISSQTLKSLGFILQELVIKDAPCLERLLPLDPNHGPATIRVISAPKLEILGILSEGIPELQFGTTVFQKMIAVGLTTRISTVRVLVLDSTGPNLDTVVNFLKCFPCLESSSQGWVWIMSGCMTHWTQLNASSFVSNKWC
uniref:Uncharacterized protein n=1 Tax=Avena sativa TaxID=4498 RepID=A0ACD5WK97_AVESA